MHAISSYRGNRPTNTHRQTGPITIHCAAASLARSVMTWQYSRQICTVSGDFMTRLGVLFVQLIVEKYCREKNLPHLEQTKFLVPKTLSMCELQGIIRYIICITYCINICGEKTAETRENIAREIKTVTASTVN